MVRLGNIDTSRNIRLITRAEILANPRLICTEPDCTITDFQISIALKNEKKQRDEAFIGPINGKGTELPGQIINLVKKYEDMNVTIYIENIHVKYNGKVVAVNPVILGYDH